MREIGIVILIMFIYHGTSLYCQEKRLKKDYEIQVKMLETKHGLSVR